MPHHRSLLKAAVRLAWIPVLASLGACQTLGSGAEQRSFVAAHVVRSGQYSADAPIFIAQDAAFARTAATDEAQMAEIEQRR